MSNFTYNKIIANIHEIHSSISKLIKKKYSSKTIIENYKKILVCMLPVIPHFSNECIELLKDTSKLEWPKVDKEKLFDETISIVIQINGKKRGNIIVKNNILEQELLKKVLENGVKARVILPEVLK